MNQTNGPNKNNFNVCLLGASLDTGNRGVSALCASLVNLIVTSRPYAEISLLIGNRHPKPQELKLKDRRIRLNVINYRLSPRARMKEHLVFIFLMACLQRILPLKSMRKKIVDAVPFLKALSRADFIGEIRGGDSFSDIYGIKRFAVGSAPALIALLLGKSIVLLPQTYGPYNSAFAKWISRIIIRRSDRVFCRYREGVEFMKEFVKRIPLEKVCFCPDVAFTLDVIPPEKTDIQPPLKKGFDRPLIGLNINGLMYNGGYSGSNMFGLKSDYKQFISGLLSALLEKTQADVLLVPHTFGQSGNVNSDPDASRAVLATIDEEARERVHLVMQEYNQSEIKAVIGMCDFFIGSRMHACIAALSQGIPTTGIAYSHKFIGVFDSIGSGDTVVDARITEGPEIISRVLESFERRNDVRDDIKEKVAAAQEDIKNHFEKMLL